MVVKRKEKKKRWQCTTTSHINYGEGATLVLGTVESCQRRTVPQTIKLLSLNCWSFMVLRCAQNAQPVACQKLHTNSDILLAIKH